MSPCDHASGVLVVDREGLRCEDCGQVLVFVAQNDLDRLHRDLEQARQDLRDCRRGITRWAGE